MLARMAHTRQNLTMFKLIATIATMISLQINHDTVSIAIDSPLAHIWAEVEISTGDVVEWGT